jgi:hypothetical protein
MRLYVYLKIPRAICPQISRILELIDLSKSEINVFKQLKDYNLKISFFFDGIPEFHGHVQCVFAYG